MAFFISKALVTGGAGFIGSHLVEVLTQNGCDVTVLDNLTSGHLSNLDAAVKAKVKFIEGDIRDSDTLAEAIKGCEVIFHQAAVVSVTKTVEDPVFSSQVNDLGTLRVLEAARKNKVRRVVLASSSAIYGDDPQLPKKETMAPVPLSPYAVQKLSNEYYAQLYFRLYGLETACLRYFNVFGPRQDPSSAYSGVISIFMSRAVKQQQPVIYGDGRQTRDFVFVKDVVQANLLAARTKSAAGQVYNVGTGQAIEIKELWNKIAKLGQCNCSPVNNEARPGDIVHSLADISKLRDHLGFEQKVSFDAGLNSTFDWYRANL
ncbi:MAG: SDR family oxidoreductase [Desulfobacteraceae bacterium]|nr:SDR family oxidoreductase [Desulfobacteraceae bacterium]